MVVLKGFKNLFLGEYDSDEVDFGQDFGSQKSGSAKKEGLLDSNDLGSNAGGSSGDKKVISIPDPFDDFSSPFAPNDTTYDSGKGSSANSFKEERKMSFEQTTTLQIVLARPVDFSEVRSIGDDINAFKTVILNLEMVKSDDAKRILDFLSGVAYANKAQIKMMAQKTFAIMSKNVKFDGKDLLTELENNGYSF